MHPDIESNAYSYLTNSLSIIDLAMKNTAYFLSLISSRGDILGSDVLLFSIE